MYRGDVVPFQPPDPPPQRVDPGVRRGELVPGEGRIERHRLAPVDRQGGEDPEHVSPLDPLDDGRFGGEGDGDDSRLRNPAKIQPVHVAVSGLDLEAVGRPGPGVVRGHLLALEDFTEDRGAVGQLDPGDVPGPEEPQPVDRDHRDEPGDDQQAEGQGTSREPDEGVAAAQE